MPKKMLKKARPLCACGAEATVCTVELAVPDSERWECRPCAKARENRECGCCSGRGTYKWGELAGRTCKGCGGSGLNPNREGAC